MNFKSFFTAAALLLSGTVVSANVSSTSVELTAAPEITLVTTQKIDAAILQSLVEDHATQLYTLSVEDAWADYYSGDLVITELNPGEKYKLVKGGLLNIVIMDGMD